MASGAGHEGLAPPVEHDARPVGRWPSGTSEIGQGTDVVHLDITGGPADLARVRQKPGDQLLLRVVHPDRPTISDLRRSLLLERDSTEPRHQWLPVRPLDPGLEADSGPVWCVDPGLVLGGHLRHGRTVLARKGLEHGGLHDPLQAVQPEDVSGKQVVLDDAPVDGFERGDDRVIAAVGQFRSLRGISAGEVGLAFGLDHVPGDTKGDLAVDPAVAAGLLRVVVLGRDLVTEKPCRPGAGVGDQRLLLGEFQLEFVTQELRQTAFDLLGFGLRSGESKEMVIRVANITQPPIFRIVRIRARQAGHPLTQCPGLGPVTAPAGFRQQILRLQICRVSGPALSIGVLRDQNFLDELVQLVQVDVGQDRGSHSALRRSGERGAPFPVLQVSGRQHVAHQPQEPLVMDLLAEDRQQDLVVQAAEAVGDVPFDEPGSPGPGVGHLPQRGVAAPTGTESMGSIGERRLVVRLQQQADHLPDELVRPGRQAQRTRTSVLLRDVHAPDRPEAVALVAHRLDDPVDLPLGHAVHGLRRDPGRHRAMIGVDATVGQQIQLRVEQLSIQFVARQATPAALTQDTQHRCGALHFAYLPMSGCPNHLAPFAQCGRLSRPPWPGVTPATTTGPPSP